VTGGQSSGGTYRCSACNQRHDGDHDCPGGPDVVSSEHADRETVKDLVAVVNQLGDRVKELEVRVRELELELADREGEDR
jgi:hypothetical protein